MKKFLSVVLSILILFSMVPAVEITGSAASESDLTFTKNSDGVSYSVKATSTSISGDLVIPSTYGGLPVTALSAKAFYNCTALTSVTIPDSITSIGLSAFYKCTSLTTITIPDSVTTMANAVFNGCTGLVSVVLSSGVTTLGNATFSGCTGLVEVTIPDSVTTIGIGCFKECKSLEKIWWNAKSVTDLTKTSNMFYNAGTTGSGIEVVFGESVEKIPDYLFYVSSSTYTPNITSVKIPKNVTSIGENSFYNCYDIENFDLGSDYILSMFILSDYTNIETVVLGEGVTSIEDSLFLGCTTLLSVTIPESVKSIGASAFYNCSRLEKVIWNAKNIDDFTSDSELFYNAGTSGAGIDLVFGDNVEKIPAYLCYASTTPEIASVTIGKGVKSVGEYAFYNCDTLTSVTMGDGVTSIGAYAFSGCEHLTSITIPESVISIGTCVFYNCYYLEKVIWNTNNIDDFTSNPAIFNSAGAWSDGLEIVFGDGVEKVPAYFCYSAGVTSVILSDTITSIGDYAFYKCKNLTSITIPDSVTSIGECAFDYCENLNYISVGTQNTTYTSVDGVLFSKDKTTLIKFPEKSTTTAYTIPYGVTKIADSAFYNCTNLKSITILDSVTSIGANAFENCTSLATVIIGNGVTSIGANAFYKCTGLTSVTIPDSVISIGKSAFGYCTGLTSVTIGSGVESIGDRAFEYCKSLTSINIPGNVTTIGSNAFSYCTGLTSVKIGNGVKTIRDYAFYNCTGLTSITIPNSVTSIGYYAFGYCTGITSVKFNDCAASIGDYAFYECTSLTSITIPDSVISIGDRAFGYCTSLKTATIGNGVKTIESYVFYKCSITSLKIGDGVTDMHEYAFYYAGDITYLYIGNQLVLEKLFGPGVYLDFEYLTTVVLGDGVTSIGDEFFYYCTSLESVIIGDNVTSIGDEAFCDCEALTSVTIGDKVTSIGYRAFRDCDNLVSVSMGDGVISIGEEAFCSCNSLTQIILPNSLTSIGEEAFYLTELTSIKIPDNVTIIGNRAFGYCDLAPVIIGDSVESIGDEAFVGNASLTSVTIPGSVISIGENAFNYLTDVFYTSSQEEWEKIQIASNNSSLESAKKHYNCTIQQTGGCIKGIVTTATCPDCSLSMSQTTLRPEHTFVNGRCSYCHTKKSDLVESPHPYDRNSDETYVIQKTGAKSITVYFSDDTEVYLDGFSQDRIYIYDSEDNLIGTYRGTTLQNGEVTVTGDTVKIRLSSGNYYPTYGFRVVDILAEFDNCPHSEQVTENVCAVTCTQDGKTGDVYCAYCDAHLIKSRVTPAIGHAYSAWVVDRYATYNTIGERHKTCSNCSDVVTDNNVEYAMFVASFIKNGGKCDESSRILISEEPFGALPTPTKANYIFRGWTLTNRGTDYVTETDYITADTNLYASWELIVPQSVEISAMPLRTGYCVGDQVETRGLKLLVTYNDGSTKTVSSGFETEYDFSSSGEKEVAVTYAENNVAVATSYDVYVNEPARLYSDTVEANAGETVDVPVYIENNPGIVGFTIYVEYDDTVFTPVCVNGGDISGYGMFDDNVGYETDNKVQITWSGTENYYDDGELFNITFDVSADSTVRGDYSFAISYEQADTFDENTNDVTLECESTTVTVINEQKEPVEIGGGTFDATAGQMVDIPVNVINNRDLAGSDLTIAYDSNVLTFVSVAEGLATTVADDSTAGELVVNLETVTQTEQGTLFSVRFKVKDYSSGTEKIKITSSDSEIVTKAISVEITNPYADMATVIYSDSITGEIGDTVLVPVYVENNQGMYGFKIRVTYDSNLLKPATYCKSESIISSCGTVNNNISANTKKGRNYFDIMFYGDELFNENGKMFTLKFTLKQAAPGYTSLNLSYSQADTYTEINGVETDVVLDCRNIGFKTTGCFVDSDKVYLSELNDSSTIDLLSWLPSAASAVIKNMVTANGSGYGTGTTFDYIADGIKTAYTIIVKGDADGDSAIDVLDVMHVERASNQNEDFSESQTLASDLNGDGEITVEDYSSMVNLALH